MFKRITSALAAVATGLLMVASAHAVPINGRITFDSGANVGNVTTDGISAFIDFPAGMTVDSVSSQPGDNIPVGLVGQGATFTDFSFVIATNSLNLAPIAPLWVIGATGWSFQLNSIFSAALSDTNPSLFTVTGFGIISGPAGFDPTTASFVLQGTGKGGTEFTFQVSDSASGQRVPDGGATALMLGVGLLGVGLISRRKQLALN